MFVFLVSCSSDFDNNNAGSISTSDSNSRTKSNDISNLGNDEYFQTFINNEDNLVKNIKDKKAISIMYSDNNITEDELKTFYKVAGFESEISFINYYNSQLDLLRKLDNKYNLGKYSQEELKIILVNALEEGLNNKLVSKAGPCERKLRNDMLIIAAESYAMHMACGLADLTVIAGVICHGAVIVYHAASNDNATIAYEDCINK